MRKQLFDRVRKKLCILLVVLLLVSLTATSASAWYNKKGEIVAPPEKAKVETPKENKAPCVPAPVTAPLVTAPLVTAPPVTAPPVTVPAPGAFGGCSRFDDCRGCGGFGDCGRCCDKWKVSTITTVCACFIEGDGCFDRILW